MPPRPPTRWERLLDSKPIPVADHVLEEVAKLFAQDLQQWPPPLEELDAGAFAGVLRPDAPPPSPLHFEEAFKLARWELSRELEAVDDYMRNRRYLERGLAEPDRQVLLFLSRWMVEQLLALGEATDGRVSRARMLLCLEKIGQRVLRAT